MQENATNGLRLLQGGIKGLAEVQASCRFFNNPNVTSEELFEPIVDNLKTEIVKQCSKYLLAMSDWSHLDYKKHTSKKELKSENRKDTCMKIGYDLQSTIAVSDVSGEPIAPMVHNLKTKDTVYSTYNNNINMDLTHLEELSQRVKYMNTAFNIDNIQIVQIVDREADSVAFVRDLIENNALFVLRGKGNSKVQYTDEITNTTIDIKQSELADKLPLGKKVKKIKYQNKKVTIFANECNATIIRDATKMVKQDNGKKKLIKTPGKPVKVRFVVERLVDDKNNIVATWLLLSNVFDEDITAGTIATWYYYRWKIESYFKLLKSSGFNLEKWQQKEPEALFKRLLVVSQSCMLVWKIANDNSANAKKLREILIELSGKQIQRGVDFTYPALLKGLENYLITIDMLERFSVDDILKMKNEISEVMGFEI
jgi:hypothetical protein